MHPLEEKQTESHMWVPAFRSEIYDKKYIAQINLEEFRKKYIFYSMKNEMKQCQVNS